jgi:hypothetical protein
MGEPGDDDGWPAELRRALRHPSPAALVAGIVIGLVCAQVLRGRVFGTSSGPFAFFAESVLLYAAGVVLTLVAAHLVERWRS